jgi:hypothetical protein
MADEGVVRSRPLDVPPHQLEAVRRLHANQVGHFLIFKFDGRDILTVKLFDEFMCRRYYHSDEDN